MNVCAEPCLYFSFPGGCSRGNGCFYRHISFLTFSFYYFLHDHPGDLDNRPIRHRMPANKIVNSKFNPNAPSFELRANDHKEIEVDEILTPFPYELNGSHVNGGEENLIVKEQHDCSSHDIDDSLWVGAEDLASYVT